MQQRTDIFNIVTIRIKFVIKSENVPNIIADNASNTFVPYTLPFELIYYCNQD